MSTFRVFVAGGSGTIGIPLVRSLVEAGHHVTALTRSADKQQSLRALGATPAVADALDASGLKEAVLAARPTHVIHQLTALPKDGPRRASDLAPTNRLRIDGTRNLLAAAIAAGATRFVGGSFAPIHGIPSNAPAGVREAVVAVQSMESQILEASRAGAIEGIVLRYGLFYGPDNPATTRMLALVRRRMLPVVRHDRSLLPCIHVDDAVSATMAALDRGSAGGVYDIVDDRAVSMTELVRVLAAGAGAPAPIAVPAWLPRVVSPYLALMTSLRFPLSNAEAKAALGWRPAFPTVHEGLAQTIARAA
jgi:nucleoside-diphosphate-sugar epimerase